MAGESIHQLVQIFVALYVFLPTSHLKSHQLNHIKQEVIPPRMHAYTRTHCTNLNYSIFIFQLSQFMIF